MDIGSQIKKLRKQKGLSQVQLSELVGITQTALSAIERGVYPNKTTFKALSNALEVPIPLLLFLSCDENDIPEEKRDVFKQVYPHIKSLMESLTS